MAEKPAAAGGSSAVAIPDEQYELAVDVILNGASLPDSDPEQVSRAILERILAAESFDEAFRTQARLVAWREYVGRPCVVEGVHFNRTGIKDAATQMYAVVDVRWSDTGEAETVSCGGRNVLAQLLVGLRRGWIGTPGSNEVRLASRDTAEGFRVLYLEDTGGQEAPFE